MVTGTTTSVWSRRAKSEVAQMEGRKARTRGGRSRTKSLVLRRKYGFRKERISSTSSGVNSAYLSVSSLKFPHFLGSVVKNIIRGSLP